MNLHDDATRLAASSSFIRYTFLMSRSIVLSNGTLAVALDSRGALRDLYYPHVGYEDHVRGHYVHRVGIWVDGRLSYLSEDHAWAITVSCEKDSLQSAIYARNDALQVELTFTDMVYSERPIFMRRVCVKNLADRERTIKLYFAHEYEIYKSHGSDTAYFDPISHSIIHYKGRRVFLMNATLDDEPFQDFATGRMNFQGKEGTHRDAEDGRLSQNPVEHGPADSAIGVYGEYQSGQVRVAHYWIAAGQFIHEAQELNSYIIKKTPEYLVRGAAGMWKDWLGKRDFGDLTEEHSALFFRSLLYMRAHVDQDGGIIASLDSDILQFALDTYAYAWPRDGAYVAQTLIRAGDPIIAKRFLEFCSHTITKEGYFLHKYLPDSSLGSSWHPWWQDGAMQLPIQEDETALVILTAGAYFKATNDVEFLESMYRSIIERAANFLCNYREESGLPKASYDLWERKRGAHTYTSSSVCAALIVASELSAALEKKDNEKRFKEAAEEVRQAILTHLWDEKRSTFANTISKDLDGTIDASSVYGIFSFNILPLDDERLENSWKTTVECLGDNIASGGIARFENDDYYRVGGGSQGNPWIVTTLWYAEYQIARAKSRADLAPVKQLFDWVVRHAQPSGVLSEQQHPETGEQISVAPLAWSHAAYVNAVILYLEKMHSLPAA